MGDCIDCIEVEANEQSLFSSVYKKILLKFSATSFGQYAIKHVEHVLWTGEKTAKWSLPVNYETAGNSYSKDTKECENKERIPQPQLVRPLPWILFIFAIILLRLIRLYLSIIALLIGRNTVTPYVMVCFLQKQRRRLRALKYQGQRMIRIRKIMEKKTGKKSFLNINLMSIIFSIIKPVLCTNPYYVESDRSMEIEDDNADDIGEEKQSRNKKQRRTDKKLQNPKKRTIDEVNTSDSNSDDNLSCNKLLEKYANDTSDSSFKIDETDETYSESSFTEDSKTEDALNKSCENEQENQHAESEQVNKSPEQKRESPALHPQENSDPSKAIITAKEKKSRRKALKKQRSLYSHDTHHNHNNPHYHANYQQPQAQRYYVNHKHQHNTFQKKRSSSPDHRYNTVDQRNKCDDNPNNNNKTDNNCDFPNNDNNHSNDNQYSNNVENGSYENGNHTNHDNNDQDAHYDNNNSNDNHHAENVNVLFKNKIKEKRTKHGSWSDDIYYSPIGSPTPTNNGNENGNYDDNSEQM